MSAVAERRLSLDEFRRRGRQRETVLRVLGRDAVQKSMPTRLHSLIQKILVQHLGDQGAALGYEAGQEIALRLDPAHEPIPDAIAAEGAIGDP